jgi:hypothetical protein
MIPFTKCPGCQGPFKRIKQNERWHQQMCVKRCPLDYSQYHKIDFDDNDIGYFTFDTQDFRVYSYIDHFDMKEIIHIYYKVFPRGELTQKPVFILPRFEIDFSKIEDYNKKWKIWSTFS